MFDKATNEKWGMPAIRGDTVVCVNAMWQSSRSGEIGFRARDRSSWNPGSLVQVLTDELLQRCVVVDAAALFINGPSELLCNSLMESSHLKITERVNLTMVSKRWGTLNPPFLAVRKTVALLRRLVFAKVAGEMMGTACLKVELRYSVAGHCMKQIHKISLEKILESPPAIQQRPLLHPRATALALLLIGAAEALDYDAERSLRMLVVGTYGDVMMQEIDRLVGVITTWSI